jgi:hypothetical protein
MKKTIQISMALIMIFMALASMISHAEGAGETVAGFNARERALLDKLTNPKPLSAELIMGLSKGRIEFVQGQGVTKIEIDGVSR